MHVLEVIISMVPQMSFRQLGGSEHEGTKKRSTTLVYGTLQMAGLVNCMVPSKPYVPH